MQNLNRNKNTFKHPCPLCESQYQFINQDAHEICGVCGWEDDPSMRENPDEEVYAISLNKSDKEMVTFNQARKMWENGETLYHDYPNPKQNSKQPIFRNARMQLEQY